VRWGKQSIWLATSGSQTRFCGQKPTPTFDRKSDKKLDGGNERFCLGFDGFAVDENGAG
jgi:hypothetical protein